MTRPPNPERTTLARSWTVVVLFLATVTAYADRYLFSVAAERIRLDLELSDLQLGFLAGPAMAIFYALLGVPLARWADMGHRPRLIAVCLALWSAFTAACGLATSFTLMFAARVGLGVGEAGATPPAHSLIASLGDRGRGLGASVLTLATFVGSFLGVAVGGVLVTAIGWRATFMLFGACGALVAPLLLLTVREPRAIVRRPTVGEMAGPAVLASIGALLRRAPLFHLIAGYTLYFVFAQAIAAFGVVFMVRSFGLSEAEVGVPWGLTLITSSLVGTVAAAFLIDRLAARSHAWFGLLPCLLAIVATALFAAAFLSTSIGAVFGFLWGGMAVVAIGAPTIFAGVYAQTSENERALAIAMMFFFGNAIGLGLGPVLAGVGSDALAPMLGADSVRITLVGMTAFLLLASLAFYRSAAAFRAEGAR